MSILVGHPMVVFVVRSILVLLDLRLAFVLQVETPTDKDPGPVRRTTAVSGPAQRRVSMSSDRRQRHARPRSRGGLCETLNSGTGITSRSYGNSSLSLYTNSSIIRSRKLGRVSQGSPKETCHMHTWRHPRHLAYTTMMLYGVASALHCDSTILDLVMCRSVICRSSGCGSPSPAVLCSMLRRLRNA